MIIVFNWLIIFIISLILNTFLLSIVKLGFVGLSLKDKLDNLLKIKNNLSHFCILVFFISFFILLYLNYSVIYLDSKDVIVTTVVENTRFEISGDTINILFNNLGSAGVFTASARIAASLVSKHPMQLLPKTGIIGGVATGFTMTYRAILRHSPTTSVTNSNSSFETGEISVKIDGFKLESGHTEGNVKSILENYFGKTSSNSNLRIKSLEKNNILEINGNAEETNSVISALDSANPNWKDGFIQSPLENNELIESVKMYLIDVLTTNLYIHFIMIYLMVMFVIIFTCKIILDKNIQLDMIKNYPLGKYIYYILTKYISVWKTSANVWIYFIVFSLIIITMGSTYTIFQMISVLK